MKFLKDKNVCIRSILIRKLSAPKRGRRIIPAHLIKILLYFEVTFISGKRGWTTRSFFNYFMGYCDVDGSLTNQRLLIWKFSNLHVNLIFPFFLFYPSLLLSFVVNYRNLIAPASLHVKMTRISLRLVSRQHRRRKLTFEQTFLPK